MVGMAGETVGPERHDRVRCAIGDDRGEGGDHTDPTAGVDGLAAAVGQPEPDTVGHLQHVEGRRQLGAARAGDHPPFPLGVGELAIGRRHARDASATGPGDGHEAGGEIALVVGVGPHRHDVAEGCHLLDRVGVLLGQFDDVCHGNDRAHHVSRAARAR